VGEDCHISINSLNNVTAGSRSVSIVPGLREKALIEVLRRPRKVRALENMTSYSSDLVS